MPRSPDAHDLLPLTPVVLHMLLALADGSRAADAENGSGRHGYAVAQEVEAMTDGHIRMGPGTLYGSIQRMLTSGLIEEVARGKSTTRTDPSITDDDERRRYYRVTLFGRRVLELELARLVRVMTLARAKHLLPSPEPA